MIVARREFAFNNRWFPSQIIIVKGAGQEMQSVFLNKAFLKNTLTKESVMKLKFSVE